MSNSLGVVLKVLLVAIVVGTSVYFFVGKSTFETPGSPAADPFTNLKGSLVYALSPETDRLTDIYVYDLATGQESKIFDETNLIKFSPAFSPDGRYVAFSAAPIDFSSKLLFPHTEHLQIYLYDTQTKNVEKISTSPQSFRNKKAEWSPDGRYILYHGYLASAWEQNLPIREPNNWKIYLYDTITKTTSEMVNGIENVWTQSGKAFYYIANDGLHIKNIESQEDTLLKSIVSTSGKPNPIASGAMTLALSRDGSTLAWATPGVNELVLYSVYEAPILTLVEKHRFQTGEAEVYHPVFSPDGHFLAVQETEYPIERLETKPDPNDQLSLPQLNLSKPRITIYELNTFTAKKIKDLQGFDFFGTSLTQWKD